MKKQVLTALICVLGWMFCSFRAFALEAPKKIEKKDALELVEVSPVDSIMDQEQELPTDVVRVVPQNPANATALLGLHHQTYVIESEAESIKSEVISFDVELATISSEISSLFSVLQGYDDSTPKVDFLDKVDAISEKVSYLMRNFNRLSIKSRARARAMARAMARALARARAAA